MALRVGVVGLGLGRIHAEAYNQNEVVGTVVLCDPVAERLKVIQSTRNKVEATYPTIEAMFDTEALDVMSIVTPDHLHRAHAEAAFSARCHVLLTKTIAPNLDDARALSAAPINPVASCLHRLVCARRSAHHQAQIQSVV